MARQPGLIRPTLPDPTLFDEPRFRILVRWGPRELERVATTATTEEEADTWAKTLKRSGAFAVRLEAEGQVEQSEARP